MWHARAGTDAAHLHSVREHGHCGCSVDAVAVGWRLEHCRHHQMHRRAHVPRLRRVGLGVRVSEQRVDPVRRVDRRRRRRSGIAGEPVARHAIAFAAHFAGGGRRPRGARVVRQWRMSSHLHWPRGAIRNTTKSRCRRRRCIGGRHVLVAGRRSCGSCGERVREDVQKMVVSVEHERDHVLEARQHCHQLGRTPALRVLVHYHSVSEWGVGCAQKYIGGRYWKYTSF